MFIINIAKTSNFLTSIRDEFNYRWNQPGNEKKRTPKANLWGTWATRMIYYIVFFLVICRLDTAMCILSRIDKVHKSHDLWHADNPINISPFHPFKPVNCNKNPFPVKVPNFNLHMKDFPFYYHSHISTRCQ